MNALDWICEKYHIPTVAPSPIEIPNVGRSTLAAWFAELGFSYGAEVGVERGEYAEILCRANRSLRLTAVDAWQAYKGYRDHVSQEKLEDIFRQAQERLKPYGVTFIREFSMQAVRQFEDESLDFVYIDANHELPFVINDIIEWSKKVRPGGIVSGHDYIFNKPLDTRNHVVAAVDCYTRAYRIKPWFLLGSKAKDPGQVRDTARSWMWVKP